MSKKSATTLKQKCAAKRAKAERSASNIDLPKAKQR
jgi:hypothetical protein